MEQTMIDPTTNHTRYNTDDLNAFVEACCLSVKVTVNEYNYNQRKNTRQEVYMGTSFEPESVFYGKDSDDFRMTPSCLRIPSPGRILEEGDGDLSYLAALSEDRLPESLVRHVAESAIRQYVKARRYSVVSVEIPELDLPQIRIEKNVQSGPRKKCTKEEKIARLMSDGFYGPGGKLNGPEWAWRCGHRAPTAKWAYRIHDAAVYYEREKEHRETHAVALRKLGVEPRPYESFADYLRGIADKIDTGELSTASWASWSDND
jgi:hypothetical protein